MNLVIRIVVNAIALLAVAYVVPGVHVTSLTGALIAALVLGIVNAILRPVLFIITLPLQILTLGLFTLIINALLFWWVVPLRDLFAFAVWLTGLFGNTVIWRDRKLALDAEGRIRS